MLMIINDLTYLRFFKISFTLFNLFDLFMQFHFVINFSKYLNLISLLGLLIFSCF